MATITSIASGYWNDPTIWDSGTVPADGDSVTIASGHTVIFNVDQSSFTNGLAGLTINGTLKIPSQAEDPSMPDFVCLKVNANIAGSGSLLIGSSSQPIDYPQTVLILINGTVTTATVQVYGAERNPFYDFPASPIPANATTFQLQNGLPLRVGDVIAIGRGNYKGDPFISPPPSDLYFTVQSYDPTTKEVAVSPAVVNARPTNSIIGLVSRPIKFERYGSTNASLMTGSGRVLRGCWFDGQFKTYVAVRVTSSSVKNVVATNGVKGDFSLFPVHSTNEDILLVYGHQGWRSVSNITVTNAVLISVHEGLGGDGYGSFQTVKVQNSRWAFYPYSYSYGYTIENGWFVGNDVVVGIGRGDLFKNIFVDYANTLIIAGVTMFNVTVGANVSRIFGGIRSTTNAGVPVIRDLTLQGTATSIGIVGLIHDCIIKGLKRQLTDAADIC
jgi:G8 domain.